MSKRGFSLIGAIVAGALLIAPVARADDSAPPTLTDG
jgi:hypothetical protein